MSCELSRGTTRKAGRIAGLAAIGALAAVAVGGDGANANPPATAPVAMANVGTIGAVNGGKVEVVRPDGARLAADFGSQAHQMNVGQTAWITANRIHVVDFPIEASRKTKVGGGDYMRTKVTLSNTGHLYAKTRTWTSSCADGFTGGVRVILMSRDKNHQFISDLHKYGVNGECVPGAASDRTDDWVANVPREALNKTARIAIVHLKKPTNRVDKFLENAQKVADILKTVSEAWSNVSGGGEDGGGAPTGGTTGPTSPTEPTP